MKQILKSMTLGAAIGVATMFGRGDTSAQKLPSTNKAAIVKSFKSNPSEHEIKKIIINPSSYPFRGWKESNPLKEPLYLDFLKTQKTKGTCTTQMVLVKREEKRRPINSKIINYI